MRRAQNPTAACRLALASGQPVGCPDANLRDAARGRPQVDPSGNHFYSIVTAPAVIPAAGNVVESIFSITSSAPAVTLNATLGRGGAPSPRSSACRRSARWRPGQRALRL